MSELFPHLSPLPSTVSPLLHIYRTAIQTPNFSHGEHLWCSSVDQLRQCVCTESLCASLHIVAAVIMKQ